MENDSIKDAVNIQIPKLSKEFETVIRVLQKTWKDSTS